MENNQLNRPSTHSARDFFSSSSSLRFLLLSNKRNVFFCSFLGRFIFSSYLCVMFRSHRCFQSYPSAFSSLTLLPGIRIRRMCDGSPRKKIGDRRKVERHEIWLFRCVDFVSLVWAYNFCCVIIKWIFVACCVASSLLFSLAAFPEPTKKGLMFLTKLCINQSFVDLNDGGKKSP